MLQIATGKLFVRPTRRENLLRGMLYTNAKFPSEDVLETAAGKLVRSSSNAIRPGVLIYEFIERIETEERGPGVLVSSGVDSYIVDYAAVVSFALNCVCTPDVDLTRRLTTGQRGLSTGMVPSTLVRRFFDTEIQCTPGELPFLVDFVEKLIGLQRHTFLGVMRAIKTYVNGMYRITDDLELAYTLLVASVESLAQDFDGHQGDWESIEERKRTAVDEALSGADDVIAQRVREALLTVEHVALGRRFREFAIAHLPDEYFRPAPGVANGWLLGRSDLAECLGNAYQSRSKYVHQIRRLPDAITLGPDHNETAIQDRATHLTLEGLSRLMRSVLIEFVMRQPTVEREPYNYVLERNGVVQVQLSPEYWVGHAEGDIIGKGRNKLEGFLEQLALNLLRASGAFITDLRPVLARSSEFVLTIERRLRLPYLVLHDLFNRFAPNDYSAAMSSQIAALVLNELALPSSESLIYHALTGQTVTWPLELHRTTLNTYFRRRGAANGLRFPRLFEAAISLELAERLRLIGDMDECRKIVALAAENHPGHLKLLECETNLTSTVPVIWRDVMLPATIPAQHQSSEG